MLVTVAKLKELYPSVADRYTDGQLTAVVTAVDQFIKNYCQRSLERGTYTELVTCAPDGYIYVHEPPVVQVVELVVNPANVLTVTHAEVRNVVVGDTDIVLRAGEAEHVLSISEFDDLAALAEYINTELPGWSALVHGSYGHVKLRWLHRGLYVPTRTSVVTVSGYTALAGATIAGANKLAPTGSWYADWMLLTYIGGYDPVPADLAFVAAKLCIDYLAFAERMPIQRETVGDITYVYRTLSDLLTDEYAHTLAYYRNLV